MTKLYSFKIGTHKVLTEDKIFADFMNKKKKIKKVFSWKKFITSLIERLLP